MSEGTVLFDMILEYIVEKLAELCSHHIGGCYFYNGQFNIDIHMCRLYDDIRHVPSRYSVM